MHWNKLADFAIILDAMATDWTITMTNEEYEAVLKFAKLGRHISIASTFITVLVTTAGAVSQVNFM